MNKAPIALIVILGFIVGWGTIFASWWLISDIVGTGKWGNKAVFPSPNMIYTFPTLYHAYDVTLEIAVVGLFIMLISFYFMITVVLKRRML